MIKVGLTGNKYSNIEIVESFLKKRNIPVFDADLAIRYLLHYNDTSYIKLKSKIPFDHFDNGFLNKNKFQSERKMDELLSLIEIDLLKLWENFCINNYNNRIIVFKSSLLFERELDSKMDFNINCFYPKEDRIRKNNNNVYQIRTELSDEMGDLLKNKKSSYVIHTYQDAREIYNYIDKMIINISNNKPI